MIKIFVGGMMLGIAASAIASNPKPFIDVCSTIFRNTIVKGAGLGLVAGLAVTGVLLYRESRPERQPKGHTGMMAGFAKLYVIGAIPIIGALGGALVGGAISLSRRVTIQVK